jgi:hypothetical protein
MTSTPEVEVRLPLSRTRRGSGPWSGDDRGEDGGHDTERAMVAAPTRGDGSDHGGCISTSPRSRRSSSAGRGRCTTSDRPGAVGGSPARPFAPIEQVPQPAGALEQGARRRRRPGGRWSRGRRTGPGDSPPRVMVRGWRPLLRRCSRTGSAEDGPGVAIGLVVPGSRRPRGSEALGPPRSAASWWSGRHGRPRLSGRPPAASRRRWSAQRCRAGPRRSASAASASLAARRRLQGFVAGVGDDVLDHADAGHASRDLAGTRSPPRYSCSVGRRKSQLMTSTEAPARPARSQVGDRSPGGPADVTSSTLPGFAAPAAASGRVTTRSAGAPSPFGSVEPRNSSASGPCGRPRPSASAWCPNAARAARCCWRVSGGTRRARKPNAASVCSFEWSRGSSRSNTNTPPTARMKPTRAPRPVRTTGSGSSDEAASTRCWTGRGVVRKPRPWGSRAPASWIAAAS